MAIPPIPSLKREFDSITTSLTGSGTGAGGGGLVRKPLAATPSPATPAPRPALAAAPAPSLSMPPRPALGAPMASPATATSRPTPSTGGAFSAITKPLGAGVNLARGVAGVVSPMAKLTMPQRPAIAPAAASAAPAGIPSRPVYPYSTATGRALQGQLTSALPGVNTNQTNLGIGADNAAYLNAMSMGPALPGNSQPYQPPRPFQPQFNPSFSDLNNANALRPENPSGAGPTATNYATKPIAAAAPAAAAAAPGSATVPPAAGVPSTAAATPTRAAAAAPTGGGLGQLASSVASVARGTIAAAETGNRPAAVSQGGQQLPYGQMVNGVPTFSDGTGRVPRTMTDEQIARLGGSVPAVSATTPDGITLTRSMPGGAARPQPTNGIGGAEAAANLYRPQRPVVPQQSGPSALELQRYAQSDLAAIASGDIRSSLGSAARNLRSQLQYGTRAERAAAAKQLEGLSTSVAQGYGSVTDAQTRAAGDQLRAQTDLQRAGIDADSAQRVAQITRPAIKREQVQLADGSLGLLDESGGVSRATQADGQPVRIVQPRDDAAAKRSADLQAAIAETAQTFLGPQAPGKPVSTEQISEARVRAAQMHGVRIVENDAGVKMYEAAPGQWVPL